MPDTTARPATRQRDVMGVLARLQPATVADLAGCHPLAMDEQGVRNHLANLKNAGLVRTLPGRGARKFELTEKAVTL